MTQTHEQEATGVSLSPGVPEPSNVLPAWFVVVLAAGLTAFLSYGAVGLVLAIVGAYGPAPALGIGTVVWLSLLWLVSPRLLASTGVSRREAHVAAALAIVIAVGFTLATAYRPSEHVLIDQDPGFLVNSGRYLADHDSLEQDPFPGAFDREAGPLTGGSAGVSSEGGRLQFQGAHLTGVVLSMAHWVRGDALMFRAGSVMAGAVLLLMFALASRVLRSAWLALLATLLLAVTFPMWHFSRDIYSEIPMMLLLFGGLWLLDVTRVLRSPRIGLVAGLLLGATLMARTDALVFLLGLVVYGAIEWIRTSDARAPLRKASHSALLAAAIGVVPGVAIGLLDLSLRSTLYFSHGVGDHFRKTAIVLGIVTVLAVLACSFAPKLRGSVRKPLEKWRRSLASVAVGLAIAVPALLWFVRPVVQTVRSSRGRGFEQYQLTEGVPLDRSLRYYEDSFRWLAWYVGAFVLIVAIVGLAILVWRLCLGKQRSALAFVLCALPPSLLYLWRPSASAIHPWVMRRFLMITFPLIVICAVIAISAAFELIRRRFDMRAAVPATAVLLLATLAYPIFVTAERWRDREQGGFASPIYDACAAMGSDAAVLILPGGSAPMLLPQAFRSFCGVPTAMAPTSYDAPDIERLARRWEKRGRSLWVVGTDGTIVLDAVPGIELQPISVALNTFKVGPTVTHLPDGYSSQEYTFGMGRVPTS